MGPPWKAVSDGAVLTVRVIPGAKVSEAVGLIEVEGAGAASALKLKIAAPPVEGAANKAVLVFLAKTLKLPKSAVALLSGGKSRLKRIHIAGDSAERDLAAAFAHLLAEGPR